MVIITIEPMSAAAGKVSLQDLYPPLAGEET
jgi:hypothetical protein